MAKKLTYRPLPQKSGNRTWAITAACIIFSIAAARVALPYTRVFNSRCGPTAPIVVCASHLNQIGSALIHYAEKHNNRFPPDLAALVVSGDVSADLLCCPKSEDSPASASNLTQLAIEVAKPEHCSYQYLVAGQNAYYLSSDNPIVIEKSAFHAGSINILFADGHAESIPVGSLAQVLKRNSAATQPTSDAAR